MPSSSGPPLPREAIVSKPLAKGLSVQLRSCIKHIRSRVWPLLPFPPLLIFNDEPMVLSPVGALLENP